MRRCYKMTCFLLLSFGVCLSGFAEPELKPAEIQAAVESAYDSIKDTQGGKNADYIPELAKVNPHYFALTVMTVDGTIYSKGDDTVLFPLESVAKSFIYALALEDNGVDFISKNIGLNATGQKFNSVMAIEQMPNHLENPMVNAGAIQITSTIKGKDSEDKWQRMLKFIQDLSDGKPHLGMKVYQSETDTNQHNQAIAKLMESYGMLFDDPVASLDRYTKECSILVTSKQLALMGATLANKGGNPLTHQRVIDPLYVQDTLSMMTVAGLYENSGSWWFKVGLPGKSGVGGAIVAIVPEKMAIVAFSPPLDDAGNSVKGQAAIEILSTQLQLHILAENIPFNLGFQSFMTA